MKYLYKIKYEWFDGEDREELVLSELDRDDFIKLLLKLIAKIKINSLPEMFDELLRLLREEGVETNIIDNTSTILIMEYDHLIKKEKKCNLEVLK